MEYGKFKNAEELLKGYNELEKQFTKKCQQNNSLARQCEELKEKASGTSGQPSPQGEAEVVSAQSAIADDTVPAEISSDAEETTADGNEALQPFAPDEAWLQQYLLANPEICQKVLQQVSSEQKTPFVMTGGGTVFPATPSRPKTLKEASAMAKEFFK